MGVSKLKFGGVAVQSVTTNSLTTHKVRINGNLVWDDSVSTHTVTFSCQHGTVIATVDGVEIQSGAQVEHGKSVVFTIYPSAHYHYHYTNPETVLVGADVTRDYVCDIDVFFVDFSCTNGSVGATVDGIGIQSGGFVDYGKTVVFTITPNEGYEYTGTNPESVVVHDNVEKNYECTPVSTWTGLKFTAANGTATMKWTKYGSGTTYTKTIEYSLDNGSTWNSVTSSSSPTAITFSEMLVRGDNEVYGEWSQESQFVFTGDVYADGNIMSLIDSTNFESLTTMPSVGNNFSRIFQGNTTLLRAPSLPATTLAMYCYTFMFEGCTSLTTPPSLPATTLANNCYVSMFRECTSLTSAPSLPATNLSDECYIYMFQDCTSLTGPVNIAATSPYSSGTTSACSYMFTNSGTATGAGGVINVGGGTADEWVSAAGIDTNYWNVVPPTPTWTGLKFTANTAGSTISFNQNGTWTGTWPIETSADGENWSSYTLDTEITLTNVGDYVCFRGQKDSTAQTISEHRKFIMTGSIAASGDITSLLNGVGGVTDLTLYGSYTFYYMFNSCTSLTSAPSLPATTLADSCYESMFADCTSLTSAPSLPATTLADSCYEVMFYGCTGLTSAPSLPATTLASACYNGMFAGCTGLTTAPSLPATTLTEFCYGGMFYDCTSLTGPVNIAATSPYYEGTTTACSGMFYDSGTSRPSTPTDYNKIKVGGNVSAWNSANAGIDSTYWTVELISEGDIEEQ